MKKILALLGIILASLLFAQFLSPTGSAKVEKLVRSENSIPGRYIVVFNEKAVSGEFANSVEGESYQVAAEYAANVDQIYDVALKGFSAEMTEEAAKALSVDDRVQYVEEDAWVTAEAIQSNATWGLDRIDQRALPLNSSYQYNATGAGVHAYIIDSGIRVTHQEFGGRASVAADFVGDGQNGNDCFGHGTHVAGTVGSATYGVAKGVSLHAVRVLDCSGTGMVSSIIQAANWVTANAARPAVANISISLSGTSLSLDNAISNSIASGVTYSIAAGNMGLDACNYSPARIPNALTVGAVDAIDNRSGYSNQGPCVDVFAPGNSITSVAYWDDVSARSMTGTSMAAPHVAGVAALYLETHPTASAATVAQQIVNAATNGVVANLDGVTANRLLDSWLEGAPPPAPARVTIIKQITTSAGGTASSTPFGYVASNLGTSNFSLVDNDAPPADRYINPNVTMFESAEGAADITVTEGTLAGWQLNSIQCVETPGSGMTNLQNSTVDLTNRKATIRVEQGESVTCTFYSTELAPTAAPVNVSGRVVDSRGRGLGGVQMIAQNVSTGQYWAAVSNNFGYYTFYGLMTTKVYQISASSKKYNFSPSSLTITVNDNLSGVNFVGSMR